MFRGSYHKNNRILICKVCKLQKSVPQHHNQDMIWILDGSFRKIEYFKCISCNHRIKIPIHCNLPMFYSEDNGYPDMPDFTRIDFKSKYLTKKEK
jgi:hypothetical protein